MSEQEKLTYLRTHTVIEIVEDSRLVMAAEMILDLVEEITRLERAALERGVDVDVSEGGWS